MIDVLHPGKANVSKVGLQCFFFFFFMGFYFWFFCSHFTVFEGGAQGEIGEDV